ncbi:MAG: hypothetical protein AAB532_01150 [Patescibacteria group bacterium]
MKIFSIILTILLMLVVVDSSYAEVRRDNLRSATAAAQRQAIQTQNQTDRMENLRERGYKEIDRRIASLQKIVERLSQMKRLSSTQIEEYKAQIGENIDGLTVLRAKIAADTDLTTLQADVKSIVSGYRIYAFFIQYINLSAAFDRSYTVYNNMNTVYGKLSQRIDEAKTSGEDTTELNILLSDMNTKLNAAKTLLDEGLAELEGLTYAGYPDNKSKLTSARSKLKTVHLDFKAAHKDGRKIIQGLKKLSSSPSLTPTE